MTRDGEHMRLALAEAERAMAHGDVPVGAVALLGEQIVATAHNEREMRQDPTAHAELLVLREVAKESAAWRLDQTTVFVTLEPCPMCAGALVAARVRRVVYGAADPRAGACGSVYNICSDPRLNHEVEVVAGVFAQESAALLQRFFAERRTAPTPRPTAPTVTGLDR
ncbi:MAG: tRNA adenosine(34) deaminase TadA [Actinomycetota bacterium]|jgi:tRNA(adenine34) deaminase|nr:tRNA adenosine(34) deaminase TadA [Actinomycetota bacterium]